VRGLRGAGVVCKFITEGGVVKVSLEHVGSKGELWLGERGGGEGPGGPGGMPYSRSIIKREGVGLLQGI
jgi:hypothetical protein